MLYFEEVFMQEGGIGGYRASPDWINAEAKKEGNSKKDRKLGPDKTPDWKVAKSSGAERQKRADKVFGSPRQGEEVKYEQVEGKVRVIGFPGPATDASTQRGRPTIRKATKASQEVPEYAALLPMKEKEGSTLSQLSLLQWAIKDLKGRMEKKINEEGKPSEKLLKKLAVLEENVNEFDGTLEQKKELNDALSALKAKSSITRKKTAFFTRKSTRVRETQSVHKIESKSINEEQLYHTIVDQRRSILQQIKTGDVPADKYLKAVDELPNLIATYLQEHAVQAREGKTEETKFRHLAEIIGINEEIEQLDREKLADIDHIQEHFEVKKVGTAPPKFGKFTERGTAQQFDDIYGQVKAPESKEVIFPKDERKAA